MKKIIYLLAAVVFLEITIITSCTKDDIPFDPAPSISFISGADFISQDTTLDFGQLFKIGINAQANVTSQRNLTNLRISRKLNNAIFYEWDTIFNIGVISFDVNLLTMNVEGTETIEFTVTDIDGKHSKTSLNITTQDFNPTINFKVGAEYISQDVTLGTLQQFKIGINALSNASSQKTLTNLNMTRTFDNTVWFSWDTAIDVTDFSIDVNLLALNSVGTETIEFTITDIDGKHSKTSLNITTQKFNPPTINFKGGADYISQDATLGTLQQFKIGINALSNSLSQTHLDNLNITRIFDNTAWFSWDTAIDVTAYSIDVNLLALNVEGVEKIEFTITDKDGKTAKVSLNITTESSAGPINSFTDKILGSYNSNIGASFASLDGTVYSLADAKANSEKIDWVYFYGAVSAATIASPNDVDAQAVYNHPINGIQTWDIRNDTKFRKVIDNIEWNDITDDSILIEQCVGADQTKINQLAVGDLISFVAANGKTGMIKIDNIVAGADGTIDISVKVQQ
jgi:5-hydroxyisourate hydrolase-like protein (transthyretin family)